MFRFFAEVGTKGIGVTLSQAQAESCRGAGLKVVLQDCRAMPPHTFGSFDAVVSLGAFGHSCSV